MDKFELKDLPYSKDALDGISEQVVDWHWGTHQQGYVNGLNTYQEKIQQMRDSGDFSGVGSVKNGLTHNGCGMYLHEMYWENMGGDGGQPSGVLAEHIENVWGDFDTFKQEFTETAKAAGGWALLVWWPRADSMDIVKVDKHDNGALWGAVPIMGVDVWEHAYYYDQGPARGAYIENYWANLNWGRIEERFEEISG